MFTYNQNNLNLQSYHIVTHLRALKNHRFFENCENLFYDSGKNITVKFTAIVLEIIDIYFLVRRRDTTLRNQIHLIYNISIKRLPREAVKTTLFKFRLI